jgi:hypothetical protein
MNSVRLGTYQTIDNLGYNRTTGGELDPLRCIFWGGLSGILGSSVGCPLYMIKTQIQAQSHGKYAVGFQHGHKSTLDAFKRILAENGVKGNVCIKRAQASSGLRVSKPIINACNRSTALNESNYFQISPCVGCVAACKSPSDSNNAFPFCRTLAWLVRNDDENKRRFERPTFNILKNQRLPHRLRDVRRVSFANGLHFLNNFRLLHVSSNESIRHNCNENVQPRHRCENRQGTPLHKFARLFRKNNTC